MAKTLISRLDAENIVRAAVDPETHEATGDVYDSINDVSYPFGGGGGGLNITPVLSLNLTVNNADDMGTYAGGYLLKDNHLTTDGVPTGEHDFVIVGSIDGYALLISDSQEVTIADAVNCTLVQEDSFYVIEITDEDANASATVTVTYQIS